MIYYDKVKLSWGWGGGGLPTEADDHSSDEVI